MSRLRMTDEELRMTAKEVWVFMTMHENQPSTPALPRPTDPCPLTTDS
jgi:hypothetical protein